MGLASAEWRRMLCGPELNSVIVTNVKVYVYS
jgi:hypothetical protein